MKRVLIIFHSQFGNTEKVAQALASGIVEKGVEVECVNVENVDIERLVEYDLLAIGGPTHVRGISKPMKTFLDKLEGQDLKGKKAFAFDTKMRSWWAGSAGNGIQKRLKRIGLYVVKPFASAIVIGSEGPLQDGMQEQFKQLGTELASQL